MGTFDPFTNGHNEIVENALKIFDEMVVLVAVSPMKKTMFSPEERVEMLQKHFEAEKRVEVQQWGRLTVEYARQHQIEAVVRGLRPTGDFEIEFQMASMNQRLLPDIATIFLMTGKNNYFISSSLVKEISLHGGNVDDFVPQAVRDYFKSRKNKGEQ